MRSHRFFLSLIKKRQPQRYVAFGITLASTLCAPFIFRSIASFIFHHDPYTLFSNVIFRYSIVLSAITSLICYQDIIRDPLRSILDPHPIRGEHHFYFALLQNTASKTLPYVLSISGLFWPILIHKPELTNMFIGMVVSFFSVWISSIFVGYAICLGAISVTKNPKAQPYLDAIRGSNPREQAAFLYVPGASLFCMGICVSFSSTALGYLLQSKGGVAMWFWVTCPLGLGMIAFFAAKSWMNEFYAYGSLVRNDIDAQWNILDEQNKEGEDTLVYLEFLAKNRPELRRNLRQGWREFRVWSVFAWLVGCIAAFYLWRDQSDVALQFSLFAVLWIAGLSTKLQNGDPSWLETQLTLPQFKIKTARAVVSFLYAQGVVIPVLVISLLQKREIFSICIIEMVLVIATLIASYLPRSSKSFMIYIPIMALLIVLSLPLILSPT